MKQANQAIFTTLQSRIINLELEPGAAINEKELMEEFDVSRTPVREALIKLSQIGLIETRPRVGTFVTQIDIKSVKHAYEVKRSMEGLAAELASKRATDEEIAQLYEIIERFKNYDIVRDYSECILEDQKFHHIVRQASRNDILIEVLDMLNTKTARFLQSIHYVINDFDWFHNSLIDMAAAIKARDGELARHHTEVHTKEFLDQMSRHFFG